MNDTTINDQHPTANDQWHARLETIRTLRESIATANHAIREMRAAFEQELAPLRDQLYALNTQERDLLSALTVEMLAQVEAGAPKTFGGVQLRANVSVEVLDEAAALEAFEAVYWREEPLVKVRRSLDERRLAQWLKQQPRKDAQAGISGVRLVEGFTVALLNGTDDDAN